jgi:CHAD domain-containing protein
MSLALHTDEDLATGLRRIVADRAALACEELRAALECPADDVNPLREDAWDEAVHDARKRCKEVRAVARLCRDALGGAYAPTNAAFRDAARILSDARDAWTLVETVDGLAGVEGVDAALLPPVRDVLLDRYRQVRHEAGRGGWIGAALQAMEDATALITAWPLPADLSPAELRPSVARTYGRARDEWAGIAGTVAEDPQPSTHRWHRCRKRVKYCWYHVRVLEPAWPGPLGALEDALDDLSDLFGEEHDLGVLVEVLRGGTHGPPLLPDPAQAEQVVAATVPSRHQLRRRVADLAPRVLADPAGAYADRLLAYTAAVPRWAGDA